MLTIDETVVLRISELGEESRPQEACGVLLPPCFEHDPPCDSVIPLDNLAHRGDLVDPRVESSIASKNLDPHDAYVIDPIILWDTIETYLNEHPKELETLPDTTYLSVQELETLGNALQQKFMIWHTHPNGFIGPSHGDMTYRVEGFNYLVIALQDPPIATRY